MSPLQQKDEIISGCGATAPPRTQGHPRSSPEESPRTRSTRTIPAGANRTGADERKEAAATIGYGGPCQMTRTNSDSLSSFATVSLLDSARLPHVLTASHVGIKTSFPNTEHASIVLDSIRSWLEPPKSSAQRTLRQRVEFLEILDSVLDLLDEEDPLLWL